MTEREAELTSALETAAAALDTINRFAWIKTMSVFGVEKDVAELLKKCRYALVRANDALYRGG